MLRTTNLMTDMSDSGMMEVSKTALGGDTSVRPRFVTPWTCACSRAAVSSEHRTHCSTCTRTPCANTVRLSPGNADITTRWAGQYPRNKCHGDMARITEQTTNDTRHHGPLIAIAIAAQASHRLGRVRGEINADRVSTHTPISACLHHVVSYVFVRNTMED